MACINSDYYRQAGRGGIGAVMGSKNIKAIVVKGSNSVIAAKMPELLDRVHHFMRNDLLTDTNLWAYTDGTPMIVDLAQATGILPTRNFQSGSFDDYRALNAEAVESARIGKKGCFSCALGCGNYTQLANSMVEGPEYETLALCGSNCGISDLEAVIEFNRLCDDLGLDTISAGNITAFAMELTEKQIKDFGMKFGDVQQYLEVPAKLAYREGIGSELALGVKALAARYGGHEFAMESKGLEFPTILCDFWALSLETIAEMLELVTGQKVTPAQLEETGERVVNIARLFNQREGFDRKNDTLPGRIFNEYITTGATAGKNLPRADFEKMLADYYAIRGWNHDGKVPKTKIEDLSL
jgi:aldehyde:ferredoxin oxidoreductase